jgi:small subunit ribosomal protein S6
MLNYEVTFIADPVLSGDEIKKTVQSYSDLLASEGCKITHSDALGLKQLAYPINKKQSGIYHTIEFQTESGKIVPQMELAFRRDERIMRFLTVKLDKHGLKYNEDKRAGKIGKSRKTVEREEEKKKEQMKETQVPKNADKPIKLPPGMADAAAKADAKAAAAAKVAESAPAPAKEEVKVEAPAAAAPVAETKPAEVKAEETAPAVAEKVAASAAPTAAPTTTSTTTEKITVKATGDAVDLTKIEGIGPKAAEALLAAGVVSYTHLKLKSADDIKSILSSASSTLSSLDPTTWAKQAEYAANGEWDALKKWQDELVGGKESSSEE